MAPVPVPTLGDKLALVGNVPRVLAAAIGALLFRPFTSGAVPNTAFKHFAFTAVRTNLDLITDAQEEWTKTPTEAAYKAYAKTARFDPSTDLLSSGLKVHWLGDKNAKKVVLYFHGGGYALAATAGHVQWLAELQKELGPQVAVLLVEYTLTPREQYPVQLKQGAEALEWLLTTKDINPSNIFLAGDSAGGNLSLGLIGHLLHPHPEVPSKCQLSEPLAGAVLISPWVSFSKTDRSINDNVQTDMLTSIPLERWSKLFLGPAKPDNYNTPATADDSWWKGLDSKVRDVLVWGGGGEILIDSIGAIAEKLKEANPKTEYVVQPNVGHEDFIIEKLLGYSQKAQGTALVESWIKARL